MTQYISQNIIAVIPSNFLSVVNDVSCFELKF